MHTDTETEDLQIEPSEDDLVVDEEEPIAEEETPQTTTNNKRARRRRRVARGGITEGTLSNDPTRDYLRRAGRVPLLSAAEEVELAIRIADGVAAAEKLEQAEEEGIELDRAERRALMKTEQSGHDAKNELVEANLRLVVSIAKRYIGRGLPFSDLIQEGNIGLMRAADKFDHTKGFKFSTYATWWIRQAVTRAIADQARTIRIPVHMTETVNKISRVQRELTVELGHEPSNAELAKALGMDEERVVEIRQLTMEPVSLETPIGEEEDSSLGDFIRDDNAVAPIEAAAHSLLGEALHEELSQLKEREQEVLVMRFGLDGNTPMTLEEVGRKLGVTRERVRQIEAKTLAKLRHPSRSKDLKEYLEA